MVNGISLLLIWILCLLFSIVFRTLWILFSTPLIMGKFKNKLDFCKATLQKRRGCVFSAPQHKLINVEYFMKWHLYWKKSANVKIFSANLLHFDEVIYVQASQTGGGSPLVAKLLNGPLFHLIKVLRPPPKLMTCPSFR